MTTDTRTPDLRSDTTAKKDIQKLQRAIVDGLEDVKAQDIQVFNTEHLSALFERVIDGDRVELVDFGTGDDPYKSMWMEELRVRYRLECLRPVPGNWVRLIKAKLRQLASRSRSG